MLQKLQELGGSLRRPAIIVDLDGTLCNIEHRRHHVQPQNGEKKNWEKFYEELVHDQPNLWCVHLLAGMGALNYGIVFVTGRPHKYREQTCEWLWKTFKIKEHEHYELFSRADGDFRQDAIVKEEIYRTHIEKEYFVVFVVDDRTQVVEMWRRIGLACLQCDKGDF